MPPKLLVATISWVRLPPTVLHIDCYARSKLNQNLMKIAHSTNQIFVGQSVCGERINTLICLFSLDTRHRMWLMTNASFLFRLPGAKTFCGTL